MSLPLPLIKSVSPLIYLSLSDLFYIFLLFYESSALSISLYLYLYCFSLLFVSSYLISLSLSSLSLIFSSSLSLSLSLKFTKYNTNRILFPVPEPNKLHYNSHMPFSRPSPFRPHQTNGPTYLFSRATAMAAAHSLWPKQGGLRQGLLVGGVAAGSGLTATVAPVTHSPISPLPQLGRFTWSFTTFQCAGNYSISFGAELLLPVPESGKSASQSAAAACWCPTDSCMQQLAATTKVFQHFHNKN